MFQRESELIKSNIYTNDGPKRVITPPERLFRRIKREFPKKKFIGDIVINEAEYELLIDYFKTKCHALMTSLSSPINDMVFATALVQIGIKHYDRNFWGHVAAILGQKSINALHQGIIGESFVKTLAANNKIILNNRSERVDNILLHGFVSDYYAFDMFEFLFKYYTIDLERDLHRNDSDMMNSLIDTIKRNDNTGRTYMLVKQTANAICSNIRGGKVRIRWLLRLIDKCFWEQITPANPVSRLSILFNKWQETSDEFRLQYNKYNCSQGGGRKSYSTPYMKCDLHNTSFKLILPTQLVRFEYEGSIQWRIYWQDACKIVDTYLYQEAVTGLKTERKEFNLETKDIFNEFIIELYSNDNRIRTFKIKKDCIRFFDNEGYYLNSDSNIPRGEVNAFTEANGIPYSEALIESVRIGGLLRSSFQFEYGDVVRLPDGHPISIGKKIEEGLLKRKALSGAYALYDDKEIPVYASAPSILVKITEKRVNGTMIEVNGHRHRLFETNTIVLDLNDRSGETGYIINLGDLGYKCDGVYTVYIDVPNDRTNRYWQYALINGIKYEFEESPYVFNTKGTICFNPDLSSIYPKGGMIEKNQDENSYNFVIIPEIDFLNFIYRSAAGDIDLYFEIPAFKWKFGDGEWHVEKPSEIWHSYFPSMISIKYPDNKIRISMEEQIDVSREEHAMTYRKIKSNGIFECDMTRFKSWFGREKIARTLYMDFPQKRTEFITVITRSYVSSHIIKGDYSSGKLIGELDIIGFANYYVDVQNLSTNEIICEKTRLENGRFCVENSLNSGMYKITVYEDEDDDSGFSGALYLPIDEFEQQLINPYDLSGKSIELMYLKKGQNSIFQLHFSCKYLICNLQRLDEKDNHNYEGKLVIGTSSGISPISYDVHVRFTDLDKLQHVELSHFNGYEYIEFLYDYKRRIIVKEEEKGLSWAIKYRRYESLFPEEYVFVVSFPNSDSGAQIPINETNQNKMNCVGPSNRLGNSMRLIKRIRKIRGPYSPKQ